MSFIPQTDVLSFDRPVFVMGNLFAPPNNLIYELAMCV